MNFNQAYKELRNDSMAWCSRANPQIVWDYFDDIQWNLSYNWREFISKIKDFDTVGVGEIWMPQFWTQFNRFGLFKDTAFVTYYLRAIDSKCSVTLKKSAEFVAYVPKDVYEQVRKYLPQEVIDVLDKLDDKAWKN